MLMFGEVTGVAQDIHGELVYDAQPVIDEFIKADLLENVVLDGEFIAGPSGLIFHAYDIMTLPQWEQQVCEMPLHFRKSVLAEVIMKGNLKRTVFTEVVFAGNQREVEAAKRKVLRNPWPGVVYKATEAPYPFGPTTDWLIDRRA